MELKYTEDLKIKNKFKKAVFIYFVVTYPQMTNGAALITKQGNPIIGEEFALICTITPSFSSTATWANNGNLQATCTSTFCTSNGTDVFFTYSNTGITVTFKYLSTAHGGLWQCAHSTGSADYIVSPTSKTNNEDCTDERVIGILVACCQVDIFVFILLLYKRKAILNLFNFENAAVKPCQRRMIYVLLFVVAFILGVQCVVAVLVLPPTLTLYCKYKESEPTQKSLSLTSPVTPDKKEKKNRKNRDKSQDIKHVDAQKNISETKTEVNESETTQKSSSLTSPVTHDKKEKNRKNQDKSQDIKQVDAQKNISETKTEVNGESSPDS